jgi:short-subunit dehydrogenase
MHDRSSATAVSRPRSAIGAGAIAVVTGATRGIGFALSRALLDRGATVYAIGRDADRLATAQARLRHPALHPRRLDVANGAAFAALLDEVAARHGRIDCRVNNAGIVAGGELADMSDAQLHALVDVNLWGVLHGSRLAAAHMRRQRSGCIINIASMAAVLPVPYSAVYTATKHAVFGLTLALREELREHGVSVHVLCPDIVDTGIFERALDNDGYSYAGVIRRHFGRAISPETAVRHLLAGVARDEAVIYAPRRSRALGTLGRLFPSFFARQVALRMRAEPQPEQA